MNNLRLKRVIGLRSAVKKSDLSKNEGIFYRCANEYPNNNIYEIYQQAIMYSFKHILNTFRCAHKRAGCNSATCVIKYFTNCTIVPFNTSDKIFSSKFHTCNRLKRGIMFCEFDVRTVEDEQLERYT